MVSRSIAITDESGAITGFSIPRIDFYTWKLNGDCLVLNRLPYLYVDLKTCINAFQILDWILHYGGRLTGEELKDLVFAFNVILKPQQNYRDFSRNNPLELLANHLAKRKN